MGHCAWIEGQLLEELYGNTWFVARCSHLKEAFFPLSEVRGGREREEGEGGGKGRKEGERREREGGGRGRRKREAGEGAEELYGNTWYVARCSHLKEAFFPLTEVRGEREVGEGRGRREEGGGGRKKREEGGR
jgi:hypothetical protein